MTDARQAHRAAELEAIEREAAAEARAARAPAPELEAEPEPEPMDLDELAAERDTLAGVRGPAQTEAELEAEDD